MIKMMAMMMTTIIKRRATGLRQGWWRWRWRWQWRWLWVKRTVTILKGRATGPIVMQPAACSTRSKSTHKCHLIVTSTVIITVIECHQRYQRHQRFQVSSSVLNRHHPASWLNNEERPCYLLIIVHSNLILTFSHRHRHRLRLKVQNLRVINKFWEFS